MKKDWPVHWYNDLRDTEDFTEEECWVWVKEMLKEFWLMDPPVQKVYRVSWGLWLDE